MRKKSTGGKPALHSGSINFVHINKCCSQVTQLKSEPKVYSNNSTPGLYWTNSFEPMTTYRTANLPRLMASSQGPGTMLNRSAWSDSKSGKSGSLQTVDSGRKTFLLKDKLVRVTTDKISKTVLHLLIKMCSFNSIFNLQLVNTFIVILYLQLMIND